MYFSSLRGLLLACFSPLTLLKPKAASSATVVCPNGKTINPCRYAPIPKSHKRVMHNPLMCDS